MLINSRRTDAWMLPTPSEGADILPLRSSAVGDSAPSYIMLAVIYTSSVRVVSRSNSCARAEPGCGLPGVARSMPVNGPLPMSA